MTVGELVKLYGEPTGQKGHERTSSPAACTGTRKEPVLVSPDPAMISTSHVERQNLTVRMGLQRFNRLTNAFGKKLESRLQMLSLHSERYNFVRVRKSLRMTPAMKAGVSDAPHDMESIVGLIDARGPAMPSAVPTRSGRRRKLIRTDTMPSYRKVPLFGRRAAPDLEMRAKLR